MEPREIDPLVLRFLKNPEREIEESYAQSEDFLLSFLEFCTIRVSTAPKDGRRLVLLAQRVIIPRIQHHPCITVQVWALLAAAARYLGRLDEADTLFQLALDLADDCAKCQAHLLRKRSLVRADQRRFEDGIGDASSSIEIYRSVEYDRIHDTFGSGLARAHLWRGHVYFNASAYNIDNKSTLLSSAIDDVGQALALLAPLEDPALYGLAIFNLGSYLSATGKLENLLLADRHIRTARGRFKGIERISQQRASLDWLTPMVRYKLRKMRRARVKYYLRRSLDAFVVLGMPKETVAVAADLARITFPDQNRIRTILEGLEGRLCRLSDDLRQRIQDVQAATTLKGWDAAETVKAAIEALREACGPKTLPCLIAWPSNS